MMERDKIQAAAGEARRFLDAVGRWLQREMLEEAMSHSQYGRAYSTKESGSLRRASLDLTRSLANMRRY